MELLNIFIQIFLFFIFFSIINFSKTYKFYKTSFNLNFIENLNYNVIIHINFFLILSFFNLNIDEILKIYFITLFILFFLIIKNGFFDIKDIKQNNINLFILFISFLIIAVDLSSSLTLGWDSQKFWIYKTINFYDGGSIESLKYLDKGDGYDYPFLGTLIWAIFWEISFVDREYFGRLFFILLYILSIFSIVQKLNSSSFIKITTFIIFILLSYDYVYFQGEQDILLFCFMAFASSLLLNISQIKDKKELLVKILFLILLCNSLIWTKAEGFVYASIIIFSSIIFLKIDKKLKFFVLLSLITLFLARILIYKFYGLNIGINSCCWNDLSMNGIYSKITFERFIIIFKYFIFGIFKNYIIILSLATLILTSKKYKLIKNNLNHCMIIFLYIGFIFSAYILSDIDLIFMLKTGMDRLIFSITPFFIIFIVDFINNKKLNLN